MAAVSRSLAHLRGVVFMLLLHPLNDLVQQACAALDHQQELLVLLDLFWERTGRVKRGGQGGRERQRESAQGRPHLVLPSIHALHARYYVHARSELGLHEGPGDRVRDLLRRHGHVVRLGLREKGGRKSAEGWARRAEKAIAAVFRSLAHRVLGRLGAGCGAARWLGRSRTTHGPPRRPLEPSRRGPEAVAKTARR